MAKGDFRFIINTGWAPETELSVIFSAAKGFYGRGFTTKCVMALFALFKPLALAVLGRSKSEVCAAISEAKEKNQLLYDCAIATVDATHDEADISDSGQTVSEFEPIAQIPNQTAKRTVHSMDDLDLFGDFDDD